MQQQAAESSRAAARQQNTKPVPTSNKNVIDESCGNVDKWWLSESSGSEDDLEQEQAPDPLYDPFADDEDEKWAGQQRNERCVGYRRPSWQQQFTCDGLMFTPHIVFLPAGILMQYYPVPGASLPFASTASSMRFTTHSIGPCSPSTVKSSMTS